MAQEIHKILETLNEQLGKVTPYRLGMASPGDFAPADVNARFMPKKQYDQLVNNIQQDGNLASLPFCWIDGEGKIHTLSGHHRVDAAKDAGVELVLYLYTDAELNDQEKTAIQLSHNSLVGQDDPDILRQQWKTIESMQAKLYSGLDDVYFQTFEPVQLVAYNERDLRMETIELTFLTIEVGQLKQHLEQISRSKKLHLLAPLETFDEFAEALMSFKEAMTIFNTSTAIQVMIRVSRLVVDFLERQEALPDGEDMQAMIEHNESEQ